MGSAGISRRRFIGGTAATGAVAALPAAATAKAARRHDVDVAIVGAGLAGLTAALGLVKEGRSVVVLEARNRVGGRVFNHKLRGGHITEAGGTFTGPTQTRIQAMADRFGVDTFPTFSDGDNVYIDSNGNRSTYSDSGPLGTAPPDPVIAGDLAQTVLRLDQMSTEVPVDAPWEADSVGEWDGQTFESWINDNTVTPQFRQLVPVATRPIFGVEPRDLSLLYTLFYIASSGDEEHAGTFERNFNTRGGAQEKRFVGGSALIPKRMARALGRRVILKAPVRSIHQGDGQVTVKARGHEVHAKRAIVAIPPMLAGRISYKPAMPALRDQLMARVAQGTLMKVAAVYETPFWRDAGLNGTAVSYEGPVNVTFDGSPPDASIGVVFGFVGGDEAHAFSAKPKSERRTEVLDLFSKYFGNQAQDATEYIETDWPGETWSRGGPVGIFGPGDLIGAGHTIREPVGRLHWSGTETSDYWAGYMDGAVRSGERVAAEVLGAL